MTEPDNQPQLDKTFDPAAIEAKWYAHWEANGLFRPERPDAQPFTIVNPPPNVTGSLHIGHALDNTLQDIVVRYERLRGKDALWVVGTDHAGIATQMVVERQLEAAQDKRTNYTREQFIDKVWEWKAESGGTITGQLRRLGCSMDWSREQFTMDPHFTRAVVKVFVDLYNEGLLYRDKRLVNWDPKLKTAISDLEVETREIAGHFWHFRYPLADGVTLDDGRDHIVVATTRPETMLADMAVAVNAADDRYKSVIGQFVELPITGRRIPIVADDHADPELGSGAVKITPGHDFNDFEVGKRAGFKPADMLNMFDAEARVVQVSDGLIPAEFVGIDRFDARKAVVARLKAEGRLVLFAVTAKDGEVTEKEAEDRVIQTPYGDRGGVVIEPWLTDQWYVNAAELAKAPIEAVKSGAIEIVPKSWEKTYFNWMDNIQPWCVSRQLWWGHRIPVWYGPTKADGWMDYDILHAFVAETEDAARAMAAVYYDKDDIGFVEDRMAGFRHIMSDESSVPLFRDPDVLDTWFSSALWPFATLGWPEGNPPRNGEVARSDGGVATSPQPLHQEDSTRPLRPCGAPPRSGEDLLARHYPNDLLISGFDILFFWCARMAMQGMHFMDGQVPWKRLYLHGLVRAADGAKMSKSKGNVVDPLGLIDQYGADALRFFMAAMESQGRDVKMDERRVEGYRNFATKLWNAARFCQANGITASTSITAPAATSAVNKWIIGEVAATVAELDKAMADLRFDAAANAIYHFVWDQFCDWYIELIKGSFDEETKAVAGWVLDQILVMLHPFMPFVTEELWSKLGTRAHYPLITARWPEAGAGVDLEAKREVEWLIALVGNLRTAKAELGIAPGARLEAYLPEPGADTRAIIERNPGAIDRLARLSAIHFAPAPAGAAMQVGAGDASLIVPLEGIIDIAAEKARLEKALATSQKEAKSLEGRLNNPAFVEKAKPEAVDKARADHALHAAEAERLAAALARLG
jgi:valyl-tRNA synthetase